MVSPHASTATEPSADADVSNLAFYYSPVIRHEYAQRHHGLTPTVAFNDIAFAGQAVIVCIVTTSQYLLPDLWGFTRSPGTRPSKLILGVFVGSIIAVAIVIFIVASQPPDSDPRSSWAWLDVIYTVSYVKLVVTLLKYAPQAYVNYKNKSTQGWSILQILLDFTGGVLSITQQGIDSYLQRDWSGITGNPVKFLLGNVSMIYDVVFITQHYVLYRHNEGRVKNGEREALLPGDEDDRRLD